MTSRRRTTKRSGKMRKSKRPDRFIRVLSHPFIHRNAKAPMPELVISSSNTTSVVPPPPADILRSPMRILKRPTASPNFSTNFAASQSSDTLAEREARYQAARERIFGGDGDATKNASDISVVSKSKGRHSQIGECSPVPASNTNVLRNPLGPSDSPCNQTSKGFKRGSGKRPGTLVID